MKHESGNHDDEQAFLADGAAFATLPALSDGADL
jgi:hypothetical protein